MIKENNKVITKSLNTVSPEDRFQSVTLDFLRSLPGLDVDNNKNHLMAALYAVGFDVEKIDAWIGLKAVDESLKQLSEHLMQQNLQGCTHGNNHDHHHGKGGCKNH